MENYLTVYATRHNCDVIKGCLLALFDLGFLKRWSTLEKGQTGNVAQRLPAFEVPDGVAIHVMTERQVYE